MKIKSRLSVCAVVFIMIVLACNTSQDQLAAGKMNIAQLLIVKGDTTNALMRLEEIPKMFPKALIVSGKAMQIINRINSSRLTKQREKLTAAQKVIGLLIKEFKPEKGEFDKYTSYVQNRQVIDQNWTRSFIQVYVNEKGDLTLLSNYYGEQWLDHTSFRIAGEGIAAKTDLVPLDQVNNHHGDFNGAMWERITYRGPQADTIIALIAANSVKKIKAIYEGKTSYIIWVDDIDKKAIREAFELSKAFKIKCEAEKMIPELEKKIKS